MGSLHFGGSATNLQGALTASFSLVAGLVFTTPARANTFDFSYQIGDAYFGISASGVLTTTDTLQNDAYSITGISGSRTVTIGGDPVVTQAITGLVNPDLILGANNLLYAGAPYLDDAGFTHTLAGGFGG